MSSAACTSRCQRSQVSPSCPSIMMPTRMTWPPVVSGIPVGSRALMYTATAGRVPRDKLCFAAAMAPSQRLLLLIPTTTHRTEDFVDAARSLDVDLVIASDRPNVMATEFPAHLLTLPFADPAAAAREMRRYAARRPLDAVVPVDDATTVVASAVGEALGLRVNPLAAAHATRDKQVMRELLAGPGRRLPLRAHAAGGLGQPGGDPGRRRGGVRGRLRAHPRHPARARGGRAGRGGRHHPGGGLRAGARGRARGAARGRRPPHPGPLRQAGSARRALLRGDDLRDPVAAARAPPGRGCRTGRACAA